jgi:hypothetical protein
MIEYGGDVKCLVLLVVPLALLSGCFEVSTGVTQSQECAANSHPQINNLELNSWQDETSGYWTMCVHFDWQDGEEGGSPPNMLGGLISTEIRGYRTESRWLDDDVIPGNEAAQGQGEIDIVFCSEGWEEDTFIDFELRVRDACGAVSNEKSGEYCLGQGICDYSVEPRPHVLEHPEIGGNGCQIRLPCPEPEEAPEGA